MEAHYNRMMYNRCKQGVQNKLRTRLQEINDNIHLKYTPVPSSKYILGYFQVFNKNMIAFQEVQTEYKPFLNSQA